MFQNDPSKENLATLNSLKDRTEKLYEKKVEDIIVRSRARWHEHGERNSEYFSTWKKESTSENFLGVVLLQQILLKF